MNLWNCGKKKRETAEFSKKDAMALLWLAHMMTGDRRISEHVVLEALDFELSTACGSSSGTESLAASVVGGALNAITARLAASERRTAERIPDVEGILPELPQRAWCETHDVEQETLEAALLAIDIFPRCVLLLTVFQQYSLDHVAGLLTTSKRLAGSAQVLAFTELTRNIARRQGWQSMPVVTGMAAGRAQAAAL